MRKLFISEMVTLDGFFAGPQGQIDWHMVDKDFNWNYIHPMMDTVDTIIFGKTTYDMMAEYWPSEHAQKSDPIISKKMTDYQKIVYSMSATSLEWQNSLLKSEINPEEIKQLKNQEGKNIVILGSGTIVKQFAELDLIDEYWLGVMPIIIGKGKTLFQDLDTYKKLKLIESKAYSGGNVILKYAR